MDSREAQSRTADAISCMDRAVSEFQQALLVVKTAVERLDSERGRLQDLQAQRKATRDRDEKRALSSEISGQRVARDAAARAVGNARLAQRAASRAVAASAGASRGLLNALLSGSRNVVVPVDSAGSSPAIARAASAARGEQQLRQALAERLNRALDGARDTEIRMEIVGVGEKVGRESPEIASRSPSGREGEDEDHPVRVGAFELEDHDIYEFSVPYSDALATSGSIPYITYTAETEAPWEDESAGAFGIRMAKAFLEAEGRRCVVLNVAGTIDIISIDDRGADVRSSEIKGTFVGRHVDDSGLLTEKGEWENSPQWIVSNASRTLAALERVIEGAVDSSLLAGATAIRDRLAGWVADGTLEATQRDAVAFPISRDVIQVGFGDFLPEMTPRGSLHAYVAAAGPDRMVQLNCIDKAGADE